MSTAQFDRVARLYRWAEYLALGPLLRHTRERLMPECLGCRQALLLGDGDGRFIAALLRRAPDLHAVAVDTSAKMLELLRERCLRQGDGRRVQTLHGSALEYTAEPNTDLVVTHFFMDCLTQDEVNRLAGQLAAQVCETCRWVISEFGVPERGVGRIAAQTYIRALYLAFRLLTGLQPQKLPDYRSALHAAGFIQMKRIEQMHGFLLSELWQLERRSSGSKRVGTT